jgi:hypothetical protein
MKFVIHCTRKRVRLTVKINDGVVLDIDIWY